MRFQPTFLLAGLGLITTVLATPTHLIRERTLVERDAAAIQSNIADINSKTIALGDDITAYTGGDTSAIEKTSTDLVATINAGTDIVLDGDDLTSTDALNLVGPIQTLTENVDATISALIDKKDPVVEAGSGPAVYSQLQEQLAAATSFADALTSKVPEALKEIADELSSGIKASIQKGIDAYEDVSTPTTTATPTTSTTTTDTPSPTETTTTPPPTSTSTTSGPDETDTSTPCETGTETPPPSTSEPCETGTETPPPSTSEPCETGTETPPPSTSEPCETDTDTPPETTDEPCETDTETPPPSTTDEPEPTGTDTDNPPKPTDSGTENPPGPTGGSGSGSGSDSGSDSGSGSGSESGSGSDFESDSGTGTSPETPEFTGAAVVNTLKSSLAGAIVIAAVVVVL